MEAWELVAGASRGIEAAWWRDAFVSLVVMVVAGGWAWVLGRGSGRVVGWVSGACWLVAAGAGFWVALTVVLPLAVFGAVAAFILVVDPGGSLAGIFVAGLAAVGVSTRVLSAWVVNR